MSRPNKRRRKRSRWIALAPALAGLLLIASAALELGQKFEVKTGKPYRVQTRPLRIEMHPEGRVYVYESRHPGNRRSCPSDGRVLVNLERWPEPEHIVMQHSGRCIRGLTVDGKRWIDPAKSGRDAAGRSALGGIVFLGIAGAILLTPPTRRRASRKAPRA